MQVEGHCGKFAPSTGVYLVLQTDTRGLCA